MILYSHANRTHFHKKSFTLSLVWKWGFLELSSGLFVFVYIKYAILLNTATLLSFALEVTHYHNSGPGGGGGWVWVLPYISHIGLCRPGFLPGGGGVVPYITYTGMCRPSGLWFWSSWFRTGYPFQRRFLERSIIFRTHESSSFVSSHLKLFKDRLLLKIRFNVDQCVNKQTVVLFAP